MPLDLVYYFNINVNFNHFIYSFTNLTGAVSYMLYFNRFYFLSYYPSMWSYSMRWLFLILFQTHHGLSRLITYVCIEILFILFRIFTCEKWQQFPDCANASISLLIFNQQNNLASPDEVQKPRDCTALQGRCSTLE